MEKLSFSPRTRQDKAPLVWDYYNPQSRGAVFFRCPNGHLNIINCPPYRISTTPGIVGTVHQKVSCCGTGCKFVDFVTFVGWGK